MVINESFVEKCVRNYLKKKGWQLTNLPKSIGEHGADITAWHPKWRKILIIEAKGEAESSKNQVKHSSFYTLLGQILSRMDKEGNAKNRARTYALAIPTGWEQTFKHKISNMKFGWKILKLRVFMVDSDGNVDNRSYSYFLRNNKIKKFRQNTQ